jgi:hypothetical protein
VLLAQPRRRRVQFNLHSNRVGLGAGLFGVRAAGAPAFKAALQKAHEARVPVAEDKQNQKWRSEVVVVGEGIENCQEEICAEEQFDPGCQNEALAVFRGL